MPEKRRLPRENVIIAALLLGLGPVNLALAMEVGEKDIQDLDKEFGADVVRQAAKDVGVDVVREQVENPSLFEEVNPRALVNEPASPVEGLKPGVEPTAPAPETPAPIEREALPLGQESPVSERTNREMEKSLESPLREHVERNMPVGPVHESPAPASEGPSNEPRRSNGNEPPPPQWPPPEGEAA